MISTEQVKSHKRYIEDATHYMMSQIYKGKISDFYKKENGVWYFHSTFSGGRWTISNTLKYHSLLARLIPIEKSIEERLLEAF